MIGENPRLIDEWQEVPPLWDAIRFEVDKDSKKGKYILTGSATPNHKGIMHSGTARIGRVRMATMSLYETGDSSGDVSLKSLFDNNIKAEVTGDVGAMDEITIVPDTVSDYLDILNRLFLLDDQPAYNTNLRSSRRLLKSAKRHFIDPSLAVAALSATPDMLYNDLNTFGFMFENLCEHDLKIYAEYNGATLYHFRDEKGNEADAVVEFPDGTWGAFEIKLGTNQIDTAATELLKLRRILEKESENPPKVLCVICGMSNMAYKCDDGVYVVPITALGP